MYGGGASTLCFSLEGHGYSADGMCIVCGNINILAGCVIAKLSAMRNEDVFVFLFICKCDMSSHRHQKAFRKIALDESTNIFFFKWMHEFVQTNTCLVYSYSTAVFFIFINELQMGLLSLQTVNTEKDS